MTVTPDQRDGIGVDLYINVEVYGGADIRKVVGQMVALAERLGISVRARLNGVQTTARCGDDPVLLWNAWDAALSNGREAASASRPARLR